MPTRASLAVETKGLLFLWLVHLNNKSNVCKHIFSLYKLGHVDVVIFAKIPGAENVEPLINIDI